MIRHVLKIGFDSGMVHAAMDWVLVPVTDPRSSIGMVMELPEAPTKELRSTDTEKDQAKPTTTQPPPIFFSTRFIV